MSFGIRNWAIRHRYQPTGYNFGNRGLIFDLSVHLWNRRNPIECGVPCFKYKVIIGHLDLKIRPSDIVTNLQVTVLTT